MFLLLPECMIDELFKNCLVDCVVFLLLPRLRLELYYVVTVSSLLAFGVKNIDYLFFNFIKNYKFRSKFVNEYTLNLLFFLSLTLFIQIICIEALKVLVK